MVPNENLEEKQFFYRELPRSEQTNKMDSEGTYDF